MAEDTDTVTEPSEADDEALWQEVNAALRNDEPQEKTEADTADNDTAESLADADDDGKTEQADDEADIWANASEAQRQAFEELQKQHTELDHRLKSDNGRVSALQKQINDLTAKLEAAAKPPERAEGHDEIPDALKAFSKEFPDEAKALSAFMREQTGDTAEKIAKLEKTIEQLQQGSGDTFHATLDIFKPDWQDVVKSNEFKQWLVIQPSETQQLYHSPNPSDGIALLRKYDAQQAETKKKAETLNEKREKRLSNAATAPSRRTEVDADGQDDDPDDLWKQAVSNVRKRMNISY